MNRSMLNNPLQYSGFTLAVGQLGVRGRVALALALLLGITGGCVKPKLIPNTQVLDSAENREVLKVVEQYRRAMENLDGPTVLSLAHANYLDRAGTPEGSDDSDFMGLKKFLANQFKQTKKIRYHIEYQRLTIMGQEATVDTYIDATFYFEPRQANPRWRRFTDHNRFTLLKDAGRWQFVSGL